MRKVWEHAGLVHERIYLGGYEIWREHTGSISSPPSPDEERETLHISDDARRVCMVETLTVTSGSPVGSPTPRFRYQYDNHLGTACVEADTSGAVISYEEYHPYGTSSYRSFQSSEVSAKRYRYTGKERDEETSLYYHGARYYAPWLGRWTQADPAGTVDGTNLFAYVRGSPIGLMDPNGMQGFNMAEAHNKPAFNMEAEANRHHGATERPIRPSTEPEGVPEVKPTEVWTPPEVLKEQYGHEAAVAGDPSKSGIERAHAAVEAVRLLPQAGAEFVAHRLIETPQLAVELPGEALERADRAGRLIAAGSEEAALDELLHSYEVAARGVSAAAETLAIAVSAAQSIGTRVTAGARGGGVFDDIKVNIEPADVQLGKPFEPPTVGRTTTGAGRGLNPFKGKTAAEIDAMLQSKGYQPHGPDPIGGKGGYVNPRTGRSYHIDPGGTYGKKVEAPHVDVNRLAPTRGLPKPRHPTMPKKKYPR